MQRLFPTNLFAVFKRRLRRSATTHFSLVRTIMIVRVAPRVKIDLQFFHRRVDLLAEGNLIKLVQDCLVEAFADPVGLW